MHIRRNHQSTRVEQVGLLEVELERRQHASGRQTSPCRVPTTSRVKVRCAALVAAVGIGAMACVTNVPASSGPLTAHSPSDTEAASYPAAWVRRLHKWLDVAYVTNTRRREAGFSDLRSDTAFTPDLFQTYLCVPMLAGLGELVKEPGSISLWVASLLGNDGIYSPPSGLSPLFDTYWSVMTLSTLDGQIPDPDSTVEYLRSLRRPNGMYDERLSGEAGEGMSPELEDTHRVVELLLALDTRSSKAMLAELEKPLIGALEVSLRGDGSNTEAPVPYGVLVQARDLGASNPHAVWPELAQLIRTSFDITIRNGTGDVTDQAIALAAVEAMTVVDPTFDASSYSSYVEYVKEHVLPYFEQQEGIGYSGVDWYPGGHANAARLAAYAGVDVHAPGLLAHLERTRLENGWIAPWVVKPSVDATRFSLTIASEWSYDSSRIQEAHVAAFLRSQLVVREDAPQDLLSAYYAVAGLGLMGRELSPDERELLMRSAAVATEHAAAGYPVRYALYWYAMLARSLQWDAPTELRRSAAVVIAADQDVVLDSVWSIHRYAVWQDLAGTNVVTPSVLIAGLRRLQDSAGGFRTNRRAKSADLPTTYWAVSTLKLLGAINNNDSESVSAFVETCRGEYGYNDRPTAMEPGDGEVGAHAASLQSTGMAIELLTGFGRRPPITGTWSAWLPQLSRGLEVMQR